MEPWRTDKTLGMSTKGSHERAQMHQQSGKDWVHEEMGRVRIVRTERERDKEYLVRNPSEEMEKQLKKRYLP